MLIPLLKNKVLVEIDNVPRLFVALPENTIAVALITTEPVVVTIESTSELPNAYDVELPEKKCVEFVDVLTVELPIEMVDVLINAPFVVEITPTDIDVAFIIVFVAVLPTNTPVALATKLEPMV